MRQLHQADEATRTVAAIIDEFAAFCTLLAQPENHILVPSGQYIQKQVNTRTEQDMANEIRRDLVNLPKYTAYAKILQEKETQKVWKGKIQTLKLKPLSEGGEAMIQLGQGIIQYNSLKYLKRRTEIEKEIRERQESWKRAAAKKHPESKDKENITPPLPPSDRESDEPSLIEY